MFAVPRTRSHVFTAWTCRSVVMCATCLRSLRECASVSPWPCARSQAGWPALSWAASEPSERGRSPGETLSARCARLWERGRPRMGGRPARPGREKGRRGFSARRRALGSPVTGPSQAGVPAAALGAGASSPQVVPPRWVRPPRCLAGGGAGDGGADGGGGGSPRHDGEEQGAYTRRAARAERGAAGGGIVGPRPGFHGAAWPLARELGPGRRALVMAGAGTA